MKQIKLTGFLLKAAIFSLVIIFIAGCGGSQKKNIESVSQKPAQSISRKIVHAPKAPVPLEEYFKTIKTYVRGKPFSYDEKLVAFISNAGGRLDLWVKPVEGGEAKQITHVNGFFGSYAFSPTEDRLIYEADEGGNELYHLYLTNSKGENPVDINAGDSKEVRSVFVDWAEDGKTFLYLSNRRDQKYLDLYEYDLKSGKSQILWESSGKLSFALTNRTHDNFIILETLSDVNSNLYLVVRGKKGEVLLTPHEGDVLYTPTGFSKDGKTLYYTSDMGSEFTALYSMNLKSKESKIVLKDEWDVEWGSFSDGWRYFVTKTNVDGLPKTVITEAGTGKEIALPPVGENVGIKTAIFSKSDRLVAVNLMTDYFPNTPAIIDIEKGTLTKLVEPLPESLRSLKMVSGKSVRIQSFDGRIVPAFLYMPSGEGPFPAVIDVHGGPTSQSMRSFSEVRQYLLSKGYVVLVPNVRGSTGYGKTYTKLDNLDLGGGPLKDVVACKNWLVSNAKVDKDKVVVMGGSYGGYMALCAATFTPEEFAANVDFFGPSDLKSLVESFPPYWASWATYIYAKFGDPKNPNHAKYQYERSPINFVDGISRPLLVVQGENDARVKKDQSDRIVEKLQKRGVSVHYLVIPGEGHGFSKIENTIKAFLATDRFLDRYIWGDESVEIILQEK